MPENELIDKIKELGEIFGLSGESKDNETVASEEITNMIKAVAGTFSGSDTDNKENKNVELLNALKPFLNDDKKNKLDKCIKLMIISELIKNKNILELLG